MSVKNAMTADFLRSAYGGESMAHMRYLYWGEKARKDGMNNIGLLFEAIAYAERIHAGNHFTVLKDDIGDETVTAGAVFGDSSLVDNLTGALNGELHEIDQMYPVYLETSKFQGEKDAQRSFHYALEAEKTHATLFTEAINSAKENKDINLDSIHVCPVCGYTVKDNTPEKCPVCGVKKEMFKCFK